MAINVKLSSRLVSTVMMNLSSSDDTVAIVFSVLNGASSLVCVLASTVLFALKLHTKLVYRLALYQVLIGLVFAAVETFEIIFVDYDESYKRLCTVVGWLVVYTQWVKLLFTVWVTVHLFCFGVLQKNLKKFEVLYVVTSLFVPLVIASIPLITGSYGYSSLGCYIHGTNVTYAIAAIEAISLWNVPALAILLAASTAMVVMVIKLAQRVYLRRQFDTTVDGDQYWAALKQLLPLAAFPILFFVFVIPSLVYGAYLFNTFAPSEALTLATSVFISLWSMASGITLLVHIAVARLYGKRHRSKDTYTKFSSSYTAVGETESSVHVDSFTKYSLPDDSI